MGLGWWTYECGNSLSSPRFKCAVILSKPFLRISSGIHTFPNFVYLSRFLLLRDFQYAKLRYPYTAFYFCSLNLQKIWTSYSIMTMNQNFWRLEVYSLYTPRNLVGSTVERKSRASNNEGWARRVRMRQFCMCHIKLGYDRNVLKFWGRWWWWRLVLYGREIYLQLTLDLLRALSFQHLGYYSKRSGPVRGVGSLGRGAMTSQAS